ncbi:MAG: methionine biosynthesis protein MetW [Nitrososphaerales archaeon]
MAAEPNAHIPHAQQRHAIAPFNDTARPWPVADWRRQIITRFRARPVLAFAFSQLSSRIPNPRDLPEAWYDRRRWQALTITDFSRFCRARGIAITRQAYLANGRPIKIIKVTNLMSTTGVFLLERPRQLGLAVSLVRRGRRFCARCPSRRRGF